MGRKPGEPLPPDLIELRNKLEKEWQTHADLNSEFLQSYCKLYQEVADKFKKHNENLFDTLSPLTQQHVAKSVALFGRLKTVIPLFAAKPWNRDINMLMNDFGPSSFLSEKFWTDFGKWLSELEKNGITEWKKVIECVARASQQRRTDGVNGSAKNRPWQPKDVETARQFMKEHLAATKQQQEQRDGIEDTQAQEGRQQSVPRDDPPDLGGEQQYTTGNVQNPTSHQRPTAKYAPDQGIQGAGETCSPSPPRDNVTQRKTRPSSNTKNTTPGLEMPPSPASPITQSEKRQRSLSQNPTESAPVRKRQRFDRRPQGMSDLAVEQKLRSVMDNMYQGWDDKGDLIEDDRADDNSVDYSRCSPEQNRAGTSPLPDHPTDDDVDESDGDIIIDEEDEPIQMMNLTPDETSHVGPKSGGTGERPNHFLELTLANLAPGQQCSLSCLETITSIFLPPTTQMIAVGPVLDDGWEEWVAERKPYRISQSTKTIIVFLERPNRKHWSLLAYDVRYQSVAIYDSVQDDEDLKSIQGIAVHLGSTLGFDPTTLRSVRMMTPQQTNGFDCGIYCLVVALHLMGGAKTPTSIDGELWRCALRLIVQTTHSAHAKPPLQKSDILEEMFPCLTEVLDSGERDSYDEAEEQSRQMELSNKMSSLLADMSLLIASLYVLALDTEKQVGPKLSEKKAVFVSTSLAAIRALDLPVLDPAFRLPAAFQDAYANLLDAKATMTSIAEAELQTLTPKPSSERLEEVRKFVNTMREAFMDHGEELRSKLQQFEANEDRKLKERNKKHARLKESLAQSGAFH